MVPRILTSLIFATTTLLLTGCPAAGPALRVGAQAAKKVAPVVLDFLKSKAMEALWDAGKKRLLAPDEAKKRIGELERDVCKVDGSYGPPLKELRERIKPDMSWDDYLAVALATVDRIEELDRRVSALESKVAALESEVEAMKKAMASGGRPTFGPKGAADNGETTGTLAIAFTNSQTRGVELFLAGRVHQTLNGERAVTVRQLAAREYEVAIRVKGEEVFATKVEVKPQKQGVTHLRVPKWDEGGDGTLVLEIPKLPKNLKNVELFVDGRLDVRLRPFRESVLQLKPGPHVIVLKKNTVEVYRKEVEVKRPSEGRTLLNIDLVTKGTVAIQRAGKAGVGPDIFVYMDGERAKQWPVNTRAVEVDAEVGPRVIELHLRKGGQSTVLDRFEVDVRPGGRHAVTTFK